MILAREEFGGPDDGEELFKRRVSCHVRIRADLVKPGVECRKVHRRDTEDRAVLLRVMEFVEDTVHGSPEDGITVDEIFERVLVRRVALVNGKYPWLRDVRESVVSRAGEKTAVVLPRLHHHGKIRELRGALINVQPEQVVLNDAPDRLTRGVSCAFVDLHQDVEHVHQDMPAPRARVDTPNLRRREHGIPLPDLRVPLLKKYLNSARTAESLRAFARSSQESCLPLKR